MEISVQHHPERHRFEIPVGDEVAYAEYVERGSVLVLTHTFVPSALRGKGLAEKLVRRALDFARQEARAVDPQCSYVSAFLDRHPEYADLRSSQ